jgi:AAA domain
MLFHKSESTSAYLKMGLLGFAGSGKTYTGTMTAIGLVEYMRELKLPLGNQPIFFLDTETGSDWVRPQIEEAGIELFQAKTRAFTDLLAAVKEAESSASVLLIDSITHYWKEICDSYMKARKRTRLQFEDWAFLKGEWAKFTDLYINSSLHIVLAGRAGYEFDYMTDEETGKKTLEKTGIKMKAENEMGYEPSLLVLMERQMNVAEKTIWRTGTVLKDRSTMLDGKEFVNPTFQSFLPHVQRLNLGGKQMGVDTSRTSEASIPSDKKDWNPVQRRIVVDEIQTLLTFHIPGQAAADKKRKIELLRQHFKASWTEIEEVMPLPDLRAGYDTLHQELEGKPSRYSTAPATQEQGKAALVALSQQSVAESIKDSLPDHSAPPAKPKNGFDDRQWLIELETAFREATDFISFGQAQHQLMAPAKDKVSPDTWKLAEAMARSKVLALHENTLAEG